MGVSVRVALDVGVALGDGVAVSVAVNVRVTVAVGVAVGGIVGVIVCVTDGVDVNAAHAVPPTQAAPATAVQLPQPAPVS